MKWNPPVREEKTYEIAVNVNEQLREVALTTWRTSCQSI